STVIWCTGLHANYSFLNLPSLRFDAKGWPIAPHGIVEQIPGLYFLGIPFQVGLTSSLVGGVGRDASLVVDYIEQRSSTMSPDRIVEASEETTSNWPIFF